jgi:hypothetical protein
MPNSKIGVPSSTIIGENIMDNSSFVTVPVGMSCVNAFHALWTNSKPALFLSNRPELEQRQATVVGTAEKVADLFKHHTYFDYEGGRMLKTDFSEFPKLNARLYDRDFGPGAAQKALNQYNRVPSDQRFDINDSFDFALLTK